MKSMSGNNWSGIFAIVAVAMFFSVGSIGSAQSVVAWGGSPYHHDTSIPLNMTNPVAIAAGAFHNLILQGDGTVKSTGDNHYGETNIPPDLTNATAIAAGFYFNVALRSDHRVVAWGNNLYGQTNVPASSTNVVAIAARKAHCLALRSDGTVVAWGNNENNQTNVPDQLTDVIAISAGYLHNLALRSDHSVISWGSQSLVPAAANHAIAISAGYEHSLALKPDGTIVAWGDNSYGQCTVPASVTNAVAISAGWWHSMAILDNGDIAVWGQCGIPFTNTINGGFILVSNVPSGLHNVAQIACGEFHDLALVTSGAPQVDVPTPTLPAHVGSQTMLVANVAGTSPLAYQWYHDATPLSGATNRWLQFTNVQPSDAGTYTLVASNNVSQTSSAPVVLSVDSTPYFLTTLPTHQNAMVGTPWCLSIEATGEQLLTFQSQLNGANLADNGRISGTASPNLCFNPAAIEDSGLLTLIVTNDFGSYTGLLANLTITPVIGWGDNSSGQLQVPATVNNVAALAAGGDHNLALLAGGTITAWGNNDYNQNTIPPAANQAVAIAEGDTHSLALKADGSVVAWGDNSYGQTNVPATVNNAVAIAAGARFSQALLTNGSIIQWGASHPLASTFTNVMLLSTKGTHTLALRADGSVVDSQQASVSQTNVIAICAGDADSLVLRGDGSLAAWGKNYYGQTNIPAPATNIVAIAAGDDHFVALRADGVVIAWGSTNFSQTSIPALTQSIGFIAAGSVHSLAVLGQPFQRTAKPGEAITFSAGTLGNRLATYQWQFNGTDIPGATNATYTLENAYWANSGIYRVIVSNTIGSVASPAMTLAIPPFKLEVVAQNMFNTNDAFQMRLTGSSGLNSVTFYTSTNLLDWQPIFTNPPTTDTIDFTDMPPVGTAQRFYRAIEQP